MATSKPLQKKSALNFDFIIALLTDLLIDAILIGLGMVLYYQFFIHEIYPVTISPALTEPVGGLTNAAYIISGIPFVIGILNLVRTISRAYHKLLGR